MPLTTGRSSMSLACILAAAHTEGQQKLMGKMR